MFEQNSVKIGKIEEKLHNSSALSQSDLEFLRIMMERDRAAELDSANSNEVRSIEQKSPSNTKSDQHPAGIWNPASCLPTMVGVGENDGDDVQIEDDDDEAPSSASASAMPHPSPSLLSSSASYGIQYRCKFCNYKGDNEDEINQHQIACIDVRPYQCPIKGCTKRFKKRGALEQHHRSHTGKRPYSCLYCEKRFLQKCHLDQHERIHTGIKPYICSYCDRSFRQSSQLKSHEQTHH